MAAANCSNVVVGFPMITVRVGMRDISTGVLRSMKMSERTYTDAAGNVLPRHAVYGRDDCWIVTDETLFQDTRLCNFPTQRAAEDWLQNSTVEEYEKQRRVAEVEAKLDREP
jgi:hypothetical protein